MKTGLLLLLLPPISCSGSEEMTPEKDTATGDITYDFIVDQKGSGDFLSVQEAIDAARSFQQDHQYILVKNGTYQEEIEIPKGKDNLVLIGETKGEVVLTFDNAAEKIDEETGAPFGTSGSASTYIHGEGFVAVNMTFENSAGTEHGPGLAVYVNSDRALFYHCSFLGRQDTFYGNRKRMFLKNCYLEGTVDFIFGPVTAVFENCEKIGRAHV